MVAPELGSQIGNAGGARPPPKNVVTSVENKIPSGSHPGDLFRVWQERQKLITPLKDPTVDVIILDAGTGTGKTRFGSQIALEALGPTSKMIVTENLRRATEASAEKIAQDMKVTYGQEVGATNRYKHKATKDTRMLFCPVQSLLIRLENDPNLEGINLVAMDEVHKESKANEMCMIQLRELQKKRKTAGKPLKLMFISATLDKEKITKSFEAKGAKVETVSIPGENIDVPPIFSTTPLPEFKKLPTAAALKVKESIASGDKGNIIVFLSGKREIDNATASLTDLKDVDIVPYYGTLPREEQEKLFADTGRRKVVLATNAAQESLTLDAHIVIDTTVHKHMELDVATGRQYLKEELVPESHLMQRKGRVGRKPLTKEQEDAGYKYKYYALCTKEEWNARPKQESAEMQRTDLTQEALLMYADGYNPYSFNYINQPETSHITAAVNRLVKLGALDNEVLTDKGKFMALLQLKPNLSSMVYASIQHGCAYQAAGLAAILEEYPMAFSEGNDTMKAQFKHPTSDLLGYLTMFNTYHSMDKGQRRQWAKNMGLQYQKMQDADEVFIELQRQIKEKNPSVNFKTEPSIGSLDKAIYEGFADSLVSQGKDLAYLLEDATGHVRIGKYSALSKDKPKHFVAVDIHPQLKDGATNIIDRYVTLGHPIPEEVLNELKKGLKENDTSAKTAQTKAAATKIEKETAEKKSSTAKATEDKEKSAPVKKPSVWQRFKNWFSWIFLGKK